MTQSPVTIEVPFGKGKTRRQLDEEMSVLEPGEVVQGPRCSYIVDRLVGEGKACRVYLAEDDNGNEYALKLFKLGPNSCSTMYRELQFSLFLRNSSNYFVESYETLTHKNKEILSQELLTGTLLDIEHSFQPGFISQWLIQTLSHHLLGALAHMKRCNIVHGDIKPQNIMWDGNQEFFKLVDFGLSFSLDDEDMTHRIQTLQYRAPESVVWNSHISKKTDRKSLNCVEVERPSFPSDLWSVGCVLVELMVGKKLFLNRPKCASEVLQHLNRHKKRAQIYFEEDFFENIWDLITHCLVSDPHQRLTPLELLELPWAKMKTEYPTKDDNCFIPKRCICLLNFIPTITPKEEKQKAIDWATKAAADIEGYSEHKVSAKCGSVFLLFKNVKYSEEAYLSFTKLSYKTFSVIPIFYSYLLYNQNIWQT